VLHFLLSGQAYFAAVGLACGGLWLATTGSARWRRAGFGLYVLAAILFAFAGGWTDAVVSTALVTAHLVVGGLWWRRRGSNAVTPSAVTDAKRTSRRPTSHRPNAVIGLACVWIVLAVWEMPRQIAPTCAPGQPRAVTIFADSLTAGMEENEAVTWPRLLAQAHDIEVHDWSRMGETVKSALERNRHRPIPPSIVLIELGGNDLLGSTTATDFEAALDRLLAHVAAPGREVFLFELPPLPWDASFTAAQRRVARRYSVKLIPKRVLTGVVFSEGARVDGVHLSQAGHDRMARVVWDLLRPGWE
jgi:acyl-CoA thioesterase-1